MATKPDVRLKIGALTGDADLDAFRADVQYISRKISKDPPKIVLQLNETVTTYKIQQQLNNIIKDLKLNPVDINVKTNVTGKASQQGSSKQSGKAQDDEISNLAATMQKFQSQKFATEFQQIEQRVRALGQYAGDAKPKFNELSQSFENAKNKAIEYENALSQGKGNEWLENNKADILDLDNKYKKLTETVKGFQSVQSAENKNDTSYAKDTRDLQNLIIQLENYKRVNDKIQTNSTAASTLDNLISKSRNLLSSGQFDGKDVANLITEIKQAQIAFKDLGLEGQTWLTRIQSQLSKLGIYFTAAGAFMMARRVIGNVISEITVLDSKITDLQIATGKTRSETKELVNTYSELGKSIGATTVQVAEAGDAWLRQGYSLEETNTLIKNSIMLSKLGQIDSAASTKALTSAMKGYNKSVAESEDIVSKFTAVDMSAAVSAGYLATAMAETATSARIAGVDMDKLIGYIATIGEVTQDGAESVGNSLKTIFARMGNIKAGNLVDPESAESLSDVETTLNGLDIKLRSNAGDFRNFGEVLDEVSSRWNSFSDVQKRSIAVAFGGTRQQEKLLTLFEHYGEALNYTEISANSAGTALQKYQDSYMNSIEASKDAFSSQFSEFATSFLDSDLVKGIIDTSTGILGFFTALTKFLNENIIGQAIRDITLLTTALAVMQAVAGAGWFAKLFNVGGHEMMCSKCA